MIDNFWNKNGARGINVYSFFLKEYTQCQYRIDKTARLHYEENLYVWDLLFFEQKEIIISISK